ncbi:MAG: PH domain-containing protein [bacterium]
MTNLFSIFTSSSNSFEGKHDDEVVLLYLHRHWYTLVSKLVYLFLGSLLPFLLIYVFGTLIVHYQLASLVVFLWSAYYMILWYVFGYIITMYSMDIWIVTNQRIIDSYQQGFFNRSVSEVGLENIQDISIKIVGAIPTAFNYGDIEVQSAAAVDRFNFDHIPDPQGVKDVISKAIGEFKANHFKDEAFEVVRQVEKAKVDTYTPAEPSEYTGTGDETPTENVPENLPQ